MKKIYLLISALFVLSMCSCSFFTTSWGTGMKRDLSETYSKMSTDELARMIDDPTVINDKESANKLLEEIGKKGNVTSLPAEKQNAVLNLMVNNSISTETLTQATNALNNKDSNQDIEKFASDIIASIDTTDTTAAKQILAGNIDNLDNLDDSTASLAAICLFAQVAKSDSALTAENVKTEVENMMQSGKSVDDALTSLGVTDESKDTLEVAFEALMKLKERNAEIVSGVKISSMFGA